jgi:hypothetical protein
VATVSAYQQLLALDVVTLNEFGIAQPLDSSFSSNSNSDTFSTEGDGTATGAARTSGNGGGSNMGRSDHKVGGPPPSSAPHSTAFVASFGFRDARQNLEQKDQIAFYSRSLCVEYQVEFRSFIPPLLTENFSNGIAFLPDFVPNEADLCQCAPQHRSRTV